MNELIQQLISQIGVNQDQAEGGVGLLLKVAQEKLSSGDFAEVAKAIPGAAALLGAAPANGGGSSLIGSLASALGGGGKLGTLAELVGGFGKLGINADTARQFGPVILDYLQKNGSSQAVAVIKKLLG